MTEDIHELARIADYLSRRRTEIVDAWQEANVGDPALASGNALPMSQLIDHIPAILDAFEARLRAAARGSEGLDASADGEEAAAAHGLHRWQQGYDLSEVIRELGLLNEVMVRAFDSHAELCRVSTTALARARRVWAESFTEQAVESSARYFELQRLEAAGHVEDLEYALLELNDIDRQRATRWREIAHDLRGNVQVVSTAAKGLRFDRDRAERSERFLSMLEHNLGALRDLLDDVTELTRLRAGQEQRQLARFNAGHLLARLCDGLQAYALSRGLYLRCDGSTDLEVFGDAAKVTRIAQNLIINALKYTEIGGVEVSWRWLPDEKKRWIISVRDTGPGFKAGPSAPITAALQEATEIADSIENGDAASARQSEPLASGDLRLQKTAPYHQRAGEGIGLSIVKRLAELLDATVEVESSAARGTTFRVLLPIEYIDASE